MRLRRDDVDSRTVGPLRGRSPAVGVLTAGGHLHARLAPATGPDHPKEHSTSR